MTQQLASLPPDSPREGQEQVAIPSYQQLPDEPFLFWRQKGEPLFWYNRFKRYRNLGYKRSLQAAVEQERAQIKALKGTEVEEKPEATRPKSGQKRSKVVTSQLVEVPKPKSPAQVVPGSWRRASVQWQWVERAAAYDEYQIDKMVNKSIDALLEGAGTSFHRTMMLKSLLEFMRENFNTQLQAQSLDPDQMCMWVARMQSLLKQIADEMAEYDESVTRVLLRHTCTVSYQQGPKSAEPAAQPRVDPPAGASEKALASSLEELRRELKSRRPTQK